MDKAITEINEAQGDERGEAKEMPDDNFRNQRLGHVGQIHPVYAQLANHLIEDGRHLHDHKDAHQDPPQRLARPAHDKNPPRRIQGKPEEVYAYMYPNHHAIIIIKELRYANGNWGGHRKVTKGKERCHG